MQIHCAPFLSLSLSGITRAPRTSHTPSQAGSHTCRGMPWHLHRGEEGERVSLSGGGLRLRLGSAEKKLLECSRRCRCCGAAGVSNEA